ncbi:redoxin domain-containing protein [Candidatus Kaiserbacteria bacterium]|nr:redoxin domain-containing protein [Candidatus Kaiserbacteria bacterium]
MKHTLTAVVVFVIIVGSIAWLESRKTSPISQNAGDTTADIKIEDLIGTEETNEGVQPDTAAEANMVENVPAPETQAFTPPETREARIARKSGQYSRAKEISTPDGFINADPFMLADYIGKKVVLVDFWTYSCINCQRTTPYLNAWYDTYEDDGFVIVGIHTPEFEFEKDYDNVLEATKNLGIEFPVVLDNDYSTWVSYNNHYWPRKYLIDIDGFIVYDHIGEGGYDETESEIVKALNERAVTLGTVSVTKEKMNVEADTVDFGKIRTAESYLGYGRSEYLANTFSGSCKDVVCDFVRPSSTPLGKHAFVGRWKRAEEYSLLKEKGGSLILHFSASKVNLVAGAESEGEVIRARVVLDGEVVTASDSGSAIDAGGYVEFSLHDLYNLIDLNGAYEEHELEIQFEDVGIEVYAFTFG